MDEIQATLEPLLRDYFHVAPIGTFRHDQIFKRYFTHSGKAERELLILCPTQSRDEWIPHVQHFAAKFAQVVKDTACDSSKQPPNLRQGLSLASSDAKLFQDTVLDSQSTAIFRGFTRRRRLNDRDAHGDTLSDINPVVLIPAMQRLAYWTDIASKEQDRADAITVLLTTGQIGPLLHLSRHPRAHLGQLSTVNTEVGYRERDYNAHRHWNRNTHETVGWKCILGDILELFFFIEILRSFPDSLVVNGGYERWVPVKFRPHCSSIYRWELAQPSGKISASVIEKESREILDQCFVTLCMEHLLSKSCGLEQDLEKDVADWFLNFLGFEILNRRRSGQQDLSCDLNATKDTTWMLRAVGPKEQLESLEVTGESSGDKNHKIRKQKDPLLLRDQKLEVPDEPDEETLVELSKLAVMEEEEATYGRKRSSKYKRRN